MMEAKSSKSKSFIMTSIENLKRFRQRSYNMLGNGRDALFDLMDAVITSRHVSSFVELSMSPVFRREWPSLYASVQDGAPRRENLMSEYVQYIPASDIIILAGDHTTWAHPHASTLKDRGYHHQPQAGIDSKPVAVGHGYSTIAWIPETEGSWALPLLHERISSDATPLQKAASQLRLVCAQIPGSVLFLGDSEYGSAPFLKETADIDCTKLLRLRPNRVLYHAPPKYQGYGRPHKHGTPFKHQDSSTWNSPEEKVIVEDPKLGRLQIQRWESLGASQFCDKYLCLGMII